MAKKKKHRKTRKQKLAASSQISSSAEANTVSSKPRPAATKPTAKLNTISPQPKTKPKSESIDNEHAYVKSDITRSVVLLGIILLVFVMIQLALTYTSLGDQVYSIIKL